MSLKDLRGRIAIVGVGTAGCGEAHGMSDLEVLAQAAKAAVEDAGLAIKDMDGLCTANLNSAMWPLNVVECLGIRPKFVEGTNIGGAAFVAHQLPAMLALDAGCAMRFWCATAAPSAPRPSGERSAPPRATYLIPTRSRARTSRSTRRRPMR